MPPHALGSATLDAHAHGLRGCMWPSLCTGRPRSQHAVEVPPLTGTLEPQSRGGGAHDRDRLRRLRRRSTTRLCSCPRRSTCPRLASLHPRQPAAHQHRPLRPRRMARLRLRRPAVARRGHGGDVRPRRRRLPTDAVVSRASRTRCAARVVGNSQSWLLAHPGRHGDRRRTGSGHRGPHRSSRAGFLRHLGLGASQACPHQAAGPHVLDRSVTPHRPRRGVASRCHLRRPGVDRVGPAVASTRRRCHRCRGLRRLSASSQPAH